MKKLIALVLATLMLLGIAPAFAEALIPETGKKTKKDGALTVDYSHIDKGYVMVKGNKGKKKLKVQMKTGNATLTYDLNNNGEYEVFPLQYGNGKYTFMLCEQHKGKMFEEIGKVSVKAEMPDELSAFLYPNQYVDYNEKTAAVVEAENLCIGLATDVEKYEAIKSYIKENFMYDFVKANGLKKTVGQLPQIDDAWNKHMGVCQDLSAIMVAMLRSQGVPAKLVIGTLNKGYHAWVSVVLNGKERSFDPTASLAGKKYSAKEYKIERYY